LATVLDIIFVANIIIIIIIIYLLKENSTNLDNV